MKSLAVFLVNNIKREIQQAANDSKNIICIKGINSAEVYCDICTQLNLYASNNDISFVAKLSNGKYQDFLANDADCAATKLMFNHQWVDTEDKMTSYRNKPAVAGEKLLILMMGTESVPDRGGLSDFFTLSPQQIEQQIKNDYHRLIPDDFHQRLDSVAVFDYAFDKFYGTLFDSVEKDILKLCEQIDIWRKKSMSADEIWQDMFSSLPDVWKVSPILDSICSMTFVANAKDDKIRILAEDCAFISRRSYSKISKSERKKIIDQFEQYVQESGKYSEDFPSNQGFSSFEEFKTGVIDFVSNIDTEQNYKKLLKTDYSIVGKILQTRLPKKPKRSTAIKVTGNPLVAFLTAYLKTVSDPTFGNLQYDNVTFEIKNVAVGVKGADDKETSGKEQWVRICRFAGGIFDFIQQEDWKTSDDTAIEFCCTDKDIFEPQNVEIAVSEGRLKWLNTDNTKISFSVKISNGNALLFETEYEWNIRPDEDWLAAFDTLEIMFQEDDYNACLPFITWKNINEIFRAKSTEEFVQILSQEIHKDDFEVRNLLRAVGKVDPKQYTNEVYAFNALGAAFFTFGQEILQNGFYFAISRSVVNLIDKYKNAASVLTWNQNVLSNPELLRCFVNAFVIVKNNTPIQSELSIEQCVVLPYHPAMLEKIADQMVFIRTGMREWYEKNMESTIEKMDNALDRLLNLSYIHSSIDAIYDDRDLQGVEKTFGYFTLYGRYLKENHFVRMGTVLEKEAIYDDDFNVRSFNQANAEAKMIINVIRHYRKTYGKNTDCLTLAFINPSDLQVVVSAITGYVASVKKLDIPIYIVATIILPEKNKGGRNYLSYWLDNLVDADAGVHIESYLEYWDEYKDIHNKIRSNTDIAFFMDVLQEPGQTFLGYQTADWPTTMKPLECRYPMVFKPNIDYVSNVSRSVDISQPQFPAATAHTQALLYAAHPDITKINKIYRRDKMNDALRAEIRSAHNQAIWVVCVDEAIDKECIRGICKGEEYPEEYPVIGFSTGDGSYGQLNLTITTRQTVKTDIQQRCKRRLKSIFYTWDDASLNTASQTCIERAPRLDGVSVLLALNPNAYEINNFLAYLMLDKIYEDTGKNYCLIHLDSYRHWFDAKNPDEEQKIPDFLVVAVDSDAAGKTVLHATVAECKIAKCIHKDEHIQKAKSQVENGISVLKAHFSPDSKSIERRYWYAQLYRALAFTRTDPKTSKLLDAIIDGEFDIDWSGEIYGFWFDSDDEQDTLYTDYSGSQDIIVHNICQKTIQRVLLKKTPSEEVEFIREIGALEQEDEPENEEFDALDDDFSETVHEDDAITMPDTQKDKDTPTNLPEILEEDKKSVAVLVSPKTEGTIQPEIPVEPAAEIALTSETADLDKTSPVEETPLEDVRLLIGKEKRGTDVFWEFGHPKLSNRHLLITGTSGQGKTYCIQTLLLELARQGISSVIFDYTDGFLPNKLEPEFQEALGEKIEQKVAVVNRIPVNPFVLQSVEIPSIGSVSEKASDVAGRISDILTHVYGFGDQQRAAIYKACKEGIDRYGAQMSFARLQELLEESKIKEAKTVSSKMTQFFDNDLFDTSNSFDWKDILNNDGKVTVIQLTNLDRTLQTIITEITLWDAWYSLTKFGNKDTPFVVVLDEAQNLSFKSGSPAEKILREGRKYGWSAWFATQFLKGALDSGEISNLQQAAERLYFKPSGEEMNYIAGQIASERTEIQDWYNRLKNMQKGQCIVQGDRIKPNGEFGSIQPALVNVTSFGERK
mgnify:FL=1